MVADNTFQCSMASLTWNQFRQAFTVYVSETGVPTPWGGLPEKLLEFRVSRLD